ncbi:helix-turn-helix domain-containing protein [Photobacterium damselae]|uniref:helix-turn-helix domain-containing protein n=1 Tax=Photobacterium damselae TaxID=38293 RepID=UPI0010FCF171|nr:helix-turn-helix transcriptional regulator [Photobacterium damselae]MBA5682378.1 helix-turn-helix transcriptional regulator [Photobacterium damselae subsp. damselae]MCG3824458.1 helix-turn-helix transcriptional regulator [Photobacterium damselae]NVH52344.1 helix-turn-helix transcriptional regulator [Photobacterium damselae subsp. damselae]NVO82852.1 helix-turn-helix transcriptional regulator [Photobacterium damselae subsp. damselae]TLS78565.1 helix-turn-helix transcriptional regulator [Phot
MIKCHLSHMMGERKLKILDVIRETGLSRNTVTLLYKETAQKVDLEAIDKLCVLFNCQVGELLEQSPGNDQ